jgi:hypothetical protein
LKKGWNTKHFLLSGKMIKFVLMKVKEVNKSKLPPVRIDNSLEKYKDQVLFKDKLAKANKMLKTTGLPKPKK